VTFPLIENVGFFLKGDEGYPAPVRFRCLARILSLGGLFPPMEERAS
jgi:hypothetical protein